MSSTRRRPDERFRIRMCVSTHGTCHRLKRIEPTLSPRRKAVDVKVVSARRFRRRFPRQIVVAHSTLRRHFWWWREEIRLFRMSPAHWKILVLATLALCSTSDHLRTPGRLVRDASRRWGCRVDHTRRTSRSTFVFTRRSSSSRCRTRKSYGWGWARRTGRSCVCPVRDEAMHAKKLGDCWWNVQIGLVNPIHNGYKILDELFRHGC